MSFGREVGPLVIAGMHRSGTSFAAAWLQHAGLDVGERLLPANTGNAFGYFENVEFVAFHERLLRASGHDPSGWSAPAIAANGEETEAEARVLIERHASGAPWGWKDPRTTLFLDLWSRVAPNASFLFVYREPAEVVDSLLRRGDPAVRAFPELAARAWLSHNRLLLDFVRARRERCILANVSAIVRDPASLIDLISKRFGIPLRRDAELPYEPTAMRTFARYEPPAELLRYFVPECEVVFDELEREADAPARDEVPTGVASRRMREAFFSEWARRYDAPEIPMIADAAQSAGEFLLRLCETRERTEANVKQLRKMLDRAARAAKA